MDLDDILEQWSQDCEIEHKLDEASRNTPKLHAKYLGYLTQAKFLLKRTEDKQNILLKKKWMWFNGKMSEDEVKARGWNPDPFDGLKIMKNDMQIFFNADKDLQEMNAKVEYLKVTIDFLKECMQNITWRHQTIRNTIDWRKFMAGQ